MWYVEDKFTRGEIQPAWGKIEANIQKLEQPEKTLKIRIKNFMIFPMFSWIWSEKEHLN